MTEEINNDYIEDDELPDPLDENPDDEEYSEEDWEPLPEDTGDPFMDELNKRLNESDREYFKNAERINGEIVHRVVVGGPRKWMTAFGCDPDQTESDEDNQGEE